MASFEPGISRTGASELIVQTLPDGSMALFEVATKNVYSLNESAAAAWEACASPTSLPQLAAAMSRRLNKPVTEDIAQEAVSELAADGLVTVAPGQELGTSRRELLKQAAEVAIPLVLVLTGVEQRAHAQGNGSPVLTTAPATTTPGTTAGTTAGTTPGTTPGTTAPVTVTTRTFIVSKFVALTLQQVVDRDPLEGAEFDVIDLSTNQVVAHIVTGANGQATAQLIPGVRYRLVETYAPPSTPGTLDAYEPFPPHDFTMGQQNGFGFDFNNVLATD